MKSARPYLLCLWFIGLASIPMSMVPAQVFNYLTGILQTGRTASYSAVWPVILLYFLCRCGIAFLDVVRTMLNGYYLELIVRDFSLHVFGRVLRISPDFFRRSDAAKISNRVIRDTRTVEAFRMNLRVSVPLTVIGLLLYAYVLFFGLDSNTPVVGYLLGSHTQEGNWLLGLLILALSPIQSYFLFFDKKIQAINQEAARAGDDIVSTAHETIAGVSEIRINNAFDYAMSRVRRVFDVYREIQLRMTQLSALFKGVGPLINALVNCLLLAIGALLCLGEVSLPVMGVTIKSIRWQDYMGFLFMAMTVHGYMGALMNFFFQWRMTRQTIQRVEEYLDSPVIFQEDAHAPDIDGRQDPLRLDGVDLETSLGARILNNLNLTIRPGEHVAFVGPSGSGKSTAMNLIARDIFPSSGHVAFGEKPLDQYAFASLAREVGFVQQDPVLFNMSIRDNILLGLRRPSDSQVVDESGRLDISFLAGVGGPADLERLLIAICGKVGLIPDLVRKALDNPCPKRLARRSTLLASAPRLKDRIREAVAAAEPGVIQFFDPGQYLTQGTVLENLIWGIPREEIGIHRILDEKPPGFTRRIQHLLKDSPLLTQLVTLGRWRFLHDRNAGALVQQASPGLYAILAALGKEDGGLEHLLEDRHSLKRFGKKERARHQAALLEIAMETHAEIAMAHFFREEEFAANVLAARKAVTADPRILSLARDSFDGSQSVYGLSMRETLLGGRVNPRVRGAYEQVDALIVQELEKADLVDELVLMGLETPAGVRGRQLSGGQMMKVALARAVLKNPSILLVDEVMAPLDERSRAIVENLLEQDFKDRTVISVSHGLASLNPYDRILVFDRGQVVQDGSRAALAAQPGLFQTLATQERGGKAKQPGLPPPASAPENATEKASELRRALALSPTFASLNIRQIAMLERVAQTSTCSENTILFQQGDAGNEFFIILDGEVELFAQRQEGEEKIQEPVAILGPGAAFGELALFGGVPRTLGARARTRLRLCSILRDDLIRLIEENPGIAVMLLQTASQRIASLMEQRHHGK